MARISGALNISFRRRPRHGGLWRGQWREAFGFREMHDAAIAMPQCLTGHRSRLAANFHHAIHKVENSIFGNALTRIETRFDFAVLQQCGIGHLDDEDGARWVRLAVVLRRSLDKGEVWFGTAAFSQ
jgi:hypothetical protein